MLRKDYIVRQFEEFGKFLAIVMGFRTDSKFTEMEELISSSALKFTHIELETAEALSNDNLIDALVQKHGLKEANLKMLADLLYEKGMSYSKQLRDDQAENAFRKALTIFEYIQANSLEIDFSLDMHFKINTLKQVLNR